jgi:hypothetical protein
VICGGRLENIFRSSGAGADASVPTGVSVQISRRSVFDKWCVTVNRRLERIVEHVSDSGMTETLGYALTITLH